MNTRCPSCERAVELQTKTYPFCCLRCKQVDLYRWLSGDVGLEEIDASEPSADR